MGEPRLRKAGSHYREHGTRKWSIHEEPPATTLTCGSREGSPPSVLLPFFTLAAVSKKLPASRLSCVPRSKP
jgi:hypothetical protein